MARDKWSSIPQFPTAHYEVTVAWRSVERQLEGLAQGAPLVLDPDYQRAHVWTEQQQRAYIKYVLAGGECGRNITWNSLGWPNSSKPVELVDGKQRLTAVRRFIAGEIPAYGRLYEPKDNLSISIHFNFRVCSLDREDVLRLYLNINGGGTPHTAEELAKVRSLLVDEGCRRLLAPGGAGLHE